MASTKLPNTALKRISASEATLSTRPDAEEAAWLGQNRGISITKVGYRMENSRPLTAKSHRPGALSSTPTVYSTAELVAKSRRQR